MERGPKILPFPVFNCCRCFEVSNRDEFTRDGRQYKLVRIVAYFKKLELIDVMRLHRFVAKLEPYGAVGIRLCFQPIDVASFEKWCDAVGEQLRFFGFSVIGIHGWTGSENCHSQKRGPN